MTLDPAALVAARDVFREVLNLRGELMAGARAEAWEEAMSCLASFPDPRAAEIAALRAQVEQMREQLNFAQECLAVADQHKAAADVGFLSAAPKPGEG